VAVSILQIVKSLALDLHKKDEKIRTAFQMIMIEISACTFMVNDLEKRRKNKETIAVVSGSQKVSSENFE